MQSSSQFKVEKTKVHPKTVFFISKDASWQRYRYDIFQKLVREFSVSFRILTTGVVRTYLKNDAHIEYLIHHPWLPLKWKPSFFPGALVKIASERPDAVLCMANISQLTELLALPLCKLLGIRFVWWTHGYDHVILRGRFWQSIKDRVATFLFHQADMVITFSQAGRDYVIAQGVPAFRVVCAPNTLDTNVLERAGRQVRASYSRQFLAEELGLDPVDRVILLSGRLLADKRIPDAILAVEQVCRILPQARLVIIGDGPARNSLEQLAHQHLQDRCIFWGETFDEVLLSKLFTFAEAFVLPAFVGLAIVHAFCFGLPIITEQAGNHGPEVHYLQDGYNGYLVEFGDIESMAARLLELLTDAQKWKRMSQNALETINQEANIDLMIRQMALALKLKARDS